MLAFFFLMWTIFTVFIEFVIMLLLSHVLALWVQGMSDSRSLTRDQTSTLCIGRESLNHWTAREVPNSSRFRQGNHANVVLYCSQDPPFPPAPSRLMAEQGEQVLPNVSCSLTRTVASRLAWLTQATGQSNKIEA